MTTPKPTFQERSVAAFLGLAVGDAYGAPLEFLRGEAVRTTSVRISPGRFRWTDDTHMSMYLAEAILDVRGAPFDDESFGQAVGDRFVEWSHDPLTPTTAPGSTCLAGVANFERTRDFHTSGIATSDGCGAVMRIAPLAMAFEGNVLARASEISARVTHAHANALEAAMAGAQLLRWMLEGERLDEDLVRRAILALRGPFRRGGSVSRSLEAAIVLGTHRDAPWLDDAAVPEGDGGWRSGSALGLAVGAAMAWGSDFRTAIDRAARIDGDSDSVACLVGMFLGAQGGLPVIPRDFLEVVPERARIEGLARRLCGEKLAAGPRTSDTDPIYVRYVHEAKGGGRIGITFAPGKKDPYAVHGRGWQRDLGKDLDRLVQIEKVDCLVPLLCDEELPLLGIEGLVAEAEKRGLRVVRFPIEDVNPPVSVEETRKVVGVALRLSQEGKRVVFHCRGGLGRAGTMAACCLVGLGVGADEAIAKVRRERPGAIETEAQEDFVRAFRL